MDLVCHSKFVEDDRDDGPLAQGGRAREDEVAGEHVGGPSSRRAGPVLPEGDRRHAEQERGNDEDYHHLDERETRATLE